MNFKNLPMTAKLMLAFGLMTVLVLAVAGLALRALAVEQAAFTAYVNEAGVRLNLAGEVLDAANARAVAARNLVLVTTPADRDLERTAVRSAHDKVQAALSRLQGLIRAQGRAAAHEGQLIDDIVAIERQYGPLALGIVDLALGGQREAAIDKMNRECRPLLARLMTAVGAYAAFGAEQGRQRVAEGDVSSARNRSMMIVAVVLALLLAGGLTVLITRAITTPIRQAVQVARTVASGDLTAHIDVGGRDETGALLSSLKEMNDSLVQIVARVRDSGERIAVGSAQIASGSADLSRRTEEQSASLQQTAASMEQMTASVRSSADIARQAADLAGAARGAAEQGGQMVSRVVATMGEISDSSRRIADITSVIDGIAFQTNILALNAAVEAARAGEQGRGFAVVAGEVRSLAQRSADAAREIKSLIGDSVERVTAGAQIVSDSGVAMDNIVAQVRRVSDLIAEISGSTRQQTAGIGQVNDAVSLLDRTTQHNAALVEQSSAAAESLKEQAAALSQLVGVFKLA